MGSPCNSPMRTLQIILILSLSFFVFASFSPEQQQLSDTNIKCLEVAPSNLALSCSICQLALDSSGLHSPNCGQAFHSKCLHDYFESLNTGEVQIRQESQLCVSLSDYDNFLSLILFDTPELPEGITYIPNLMNINYIKKFWIDAFKNPSNEAMLRLVKIQMPSEGLPFKSNTYNWLHLASQKASPSNLNFVLRGDLFPLPNFKESLAEGFMFAMACSNFTNAEIFLRHGADINHQYTDRRLTRLYLAIMAENVDCVKFLIDNNADVNLAPPNDITPMHRAIFMDNAEIIELLMKSKRVNLVAISQIHPLLRASNLGKLKALGAMLDNGFNFAKELSLLQYAITSSPLESIKFLIDRGFEFISKKGVISHFLHTTICVCSPSNDATVAKIKFLLEYGADPYEGMNSSTLSLIIAQFPFYASHFTLSDPAIVIAILKNNFDIFKVFLDYGINPNTRIFNESRSLLHLVCELGKIPMAAYLISKGADIHSLDSKGKKPFDLNTKEFANQVFNF